MLDSSRQIVELINGEENEPDGDPGRRPEISYHTAAIAVDRLSDWVYVSAYKIRPRAAARKVKVLRHET